MVFRLRLGLGLGLGLGLTLVLGLGIEMGFSVFYSLTNLHINLFVVP